MRRRKDACLTLPGPLQKGPFWKLKMIGLARVGFVVHGASCWLAQYRVLLSNFGWNFISMKNLKKILTWAYCKRSHAVLCSTKISSVLCHWHIQTPSGISQAPMFKVLYKVTAALVRQLIKYVNFPYNQQ